MYFPTSAHLSKGFFNFKQFITSWGYLLERVLQSQRDSRIFNVYNDYIDNDDDDDDDDDNSTSEKQNVNAIYFIDSDFWSFVFITSTWENRKFGYV